MGKVETPYGYVYIALGKGVGINFPGMSWHGLYGFDYGHEKGMGRLGEVSGELTMMSAQQEFLDDALFLMAEFHKRGMLDPSYRLAGN